MPCKRLLHNTLFVLAAFVRCMAGCRAYFVPKRRNEMQGVCDTPKNMTDTRQ